MNYITGGVPDEVLTDVIKSWPEGSVGEEHERKLVETLNALCKEHGYGRVPQILGEIAEIWRDSEKTVDIKKQYDDHRARCANGWNKIKKKKGK